MTARDDAVRDIEAGDPLHRIHDLPNRAPVASSKIDGDALAAAEQMPDGRHMRIREIADVYVVTDGRFPAERAASSRRSAPMTLLL